MTEKELFSAAGTEAQWLRYYGFREMRITNAYREPTFYDVVESVGYTKSVIPLWKRCCMKTITSDKPVMDSTVDELKLADGPRDHTANVFTPLEYLLLKDIGPSAAIRMNLREEV